MQARNVCSTGDRADRYDLILDYQENSSSIENNTSNVTLTLGIQGNNAYSGFYGYAMTGVINADGSERARGTVTAQQSKPVNINNYYQLATWTDDIEHNSDGTKTISISCTYSSPYSRCSAGSVSASLILTNIARKSTVSMANSTIGGVGRINIGRASTSFTHTLSYSFGSLSGTIAIGVGDYYDWTIPTDLYSQIPNNREGTGTITCETFNGGTSIGSNSTPFTVSIDYSTSYPVINSISIVDTNQATIDLTGDSSRLVKYMSNVSITANITPKNSASLKSYSTSSDGKSTTTYPTGPINNVTSGSFYTYATNTRDLPTDRTTAKTLVNYIKLQRKSYTLARPESLSTTVNLSISYDYFNSTFDAGGSNHNTLTLKWRYKEQGTSNWSAYATLTPTISGNEASYTGALGTSFANNKAYDFEIVAQDSLMTDTLTDDVTRGVPVYETFELNGKTIVNFHGEIWHNDVPIFVED